MLKILSADQFTGELLEEDIRAGMNPQLTQQVQKIIDRVRAEGDQALFWHSQEFDGVNLQPEGLQADPKSFSCAAERIDESLRDAVSTTIDNVSRFHQREMSEDWFDLRAEGTLVGQVVRPLKRVGVYMPGGQARYISSLIMGAVPAQVAGVKEIVVCTPPVQNSEQEMIVKACAEMLGITKLFWAGGAAAVAAMTWGTQTVPRVDKIVGPGGRYLVAAKRLVYGVVGIDSLAGPSELAVLCDESSDAEIVAADLLAQAEHDADAGVYLFCTSEDKVKEIKKQMRRQMKQFSKSEIIESSCADGTAVVAPSGELYRCIDALAPEHLSVQTEIPTQDWEQCSNAGVVFLGRETAPALGDYSGGPNHVLPTGRTARFASPLRVVDFLKSTNVLRVSPSGLEELGRPTAVMARAEGLDAHAESVQRRMGDPR